MFSDHGMGPAGGSGHPWGVPDGSHTVIYGLLFNGHMKTALTMATSGQSVREPALALQRCTDMRDVRLVSPGRFLHLLSERMGEEGP